ncbi:MAG: hypothetical protein NC916_02140, partial [Candidatus Omnitrophica bacterium]|nr:hypothetical protein [Candidatus Omnitrophota bacterium]
MPSKPHINRLTLLILLMTCLTPPECLCAPQWIEAKRDHFIVYFLKDEKFAQEVLDKAEDYYHEIATELGY